MQRPFILLVSALGLAAGCAGSAAVSGDKRLPVRNVVLYRSGVGYFERAGAFEGDALQFRVKQSEVGDFLASLTAVERTQGGVRSVSFDVPEPPTPTPTPRTVRDHELAPPGPEPEPTPEAPRDPRVDVKLALTEGKHDLTVAYVVGSPVWRPSYRVVFDGSDKALLQAWAVVQNTSGEDWRNIKLSLTTGAPISFRSDLGTPITPVRPLVTDSGEVVDYVPTGQTVINQSGAAAPPEAPMAPQAVQQAAGADASMVEEESQAYADRDERASMKKRAHAAGNAVAGAAPLPAPSMSAGGLARTVRTQASASVVSESVTRYDLTEPVTVPDGSSTMVAIASVRVPGEQAHLFAPEGGVPLSWQHPFSVARLRNDTGAVLEKGPISVLSNGSFMGQGLIDTLPREAQAFVPFSLDKSIVVETSEQWSEENGSLVRVRRGLVTVRRFSQRKTQFRFRNGGATATKVYVRHARWGQAELVAPPQGSELAPDKVLAPVSVPPQGHAELELVERTPVELELSIMDPRVTEAAGVWLTGAAASDPQNAPLKRALELGSELSKLDAQLAVAEREQQDVNGGASETRKNLKAVEKLASAKDLRARLLERLKQLDARNGELTQQLIESRTKRAELEVRLNEALDQLTLEPKAG